MLVFDTETRTDTAQALTFGGYRYYEDGRCLEEGIFYADDLPRADRRSLKPTSQSIRPEPIGAAACGSCGCFRAASSSKSFTTPVTRDAA